VTNFIKHIGLIIWRLVLPVTLVYLGRSETGLEYLQSNGIISSSVNCQNLRNPVFFTGVLVSFIAIPITLYYKEWKNAKLSNALVSFIAYNKDILVELLRKEFRKSNADFSIRIFRKKAWYRNPILSLFYGEKLFVIKNISQLAKKDQTGRIEFLVTPKHKSQGLVGISYNEKAIAYDFDIMNNVANNDYRLNPIQQNKTQNTRFVLTAPLYDNKHNVIAVISIDSNTQIKEPKNMSNTKTYVQDYCFKLHEHMQTIITECK